MNVLLLTPDRVGSTLLQRTLTIYMLRRGFDKPVINLHELTNGLEKYYNSTLNQEVLGKPKGTSWGYYQKLNEITELLSAVDHYKTSRLAHYHLLRRGDSLDDQIKFYEYLNKNFFIISCRRKNVFEHALSWTIFGHSKHLNVYSVEEKVNVLSDIYEQGITAQKEGFLKDLNRYKNYTEWTDKFFNVQSYFNYEDSINNLEDYILNLDFMKKENNSWSDMFGIDFDTWNKCHKLLPDLKLYEGDMLVERQLDVNKPGLLLSNNMWEVQRGADWPERNFDTKVLDNLTDSVRTDLMSFVSNALPNKFPNDETYNFINNNINSYIDVKSQLDDLVNNGFLVTNIPIKLQTFSEKKNLIKNYSECIDWFNEWVDKTGFCERFVEDNEVGLLEKSKFQFSLDNSKNKLIE